MVEDQASRQRGIETLSRTPLFKDLKPERREEIASLLELRKFPQNEIIFKEGDEGDALYIVDKGQVTAQMMHEGELRYVATYNPEDSFGEMALLSDRPRSSKAIVTSEGGADLLLFHKEPFERFLAANLDVMRMFVSHISRRLDEEAEVRIPPGN